MFKELSKDIMSFFNKLNKMSIKDKMMLIILILLCAVVINFVMKKCNIMSEHLTNVSKDTEFVMYSRTTCPHCISAKPEFEKLVKESETNTVYQQKKIKVKIVDENSNDNRYSSISGYPTFKLHKNNGDETSYTGERTFDNFKSFIKKTLQM